MNDYRRTANECRRQQLDPTEVERDEQMVDGNFGRDGVDDPRKHGRAGEGGPRWTT